MLSAKKGVLVREGERREEPSRRDGEIRRGRRVAYMED